MSWRATSLAGFVLAGFGGVRTGSRASPTPAIIEHLKTLGVNVDPAELKKLGLDTLADPDTTGARTAAVERILKAGLKAEMAGDFTTAGKRYKEATELDPSDTTALRFLGEYYRHQTGQWDLAGRVFNRILEQPADPVARREFRRQLRHQVRAQRVPAAHIE